MIHEMEKTNITGKETKKHIIEALKAVFPSVKFSLTSDFDSVRVSWTDGPLVPDVEQVLNRFESYTRILSRDDRTEPTGYEWKGVLYVGARYLNSARQLSDERREALAACLAKSGKSYNDALVFERVEAERELIRKGQLESVKPRHRPDLMREQKPVIDRREKKGQPAAEQAPSADPEAQQKAAAPQLAEVISLFSVKRFSQSQHDRFMATLTPEQKLKVLILQTMFKLPIEEMAASGQSVDEAFAFAAKEFFR